MAFGSLFGAKRKTVEDMLAGLSPLGIRLAPDRTVEELTSEWTREQIEKDGWEMMLVAMGGELMDPKTFQSQGVLSNDVWHFDAECIENHGDYARIARRACLLAADELKLESIADFVDVEAGEAWIEWRSSGAAQRHPLYVNNDWVDPAIFSLLNDELVAQGSARRLAAAGLGQDSLVVCCEPARSKALSKLTGLRFVEQV